MKSIKLKALVVCSVLLMGSLYAGIELKWGLSSRQGLRSTMEDRHVHILEFGGKKDDAFFGVYDGHGGTTAARYTEKNLHKNFLNATGNTKNRFKSAFRKTDDDFEDYYFDSNFDDDYFSLEERSGTTVLVAYFKKNKLHLSWSGDSRAVLEMDGMVAYATEDHKPFSEKDRIEKAGYSVIAKKSKPTDEPFWTIPLMKKEEWEKAVANKPKHKGNGYEYYLSADVNSVLIMKGYMNVSRGIGDRQLKTNFPEMIIVDPDIKIDIELTKKHGFLILACDGVWDVLSNKEAIEIVAKALAENKTSVKTDPRGLEKGEEDGNDVGVQYAARRLRDKAFEKGSRDNISVIVVKFEWKQ